MKKLRLIVLLFFSLHLSAQVPSLLESPKENKIVVYPSPFQSQLNIQCSSNTSIELISLTGEVILRETVAVGTTVQLQTTHLARGLYFIKTTERDKINYMKIVKN